MGLKEKKTMNNQEVRRKPGSGYYRSQGKKREFVGVGRGLGTGGSKSVQEP